MKTPHKHAAIIKAWADGETIEWRDPNAVHAVDRDRWCAVSCAPAFHPMLEFRIKPDPHAEVKAAFAAGKAIQSRRAFDKWFDCRNPSWYEDHEYRVKPESLTNWSALVRFEGRLYLEPFERSRSALFEETSHPIERILRLEIDPETLDLVSATMEKP